MVDTSTTAASATGVAHGVAQGVANPRVSDMQSDHDNQERNSTTSAPSSIESIDPPPRDDVREVEAEKNLKWWDVTSLIINKMVGSGIFVGPALTMQYTGNKALTLGFWVIGFFYTLISMWIYLEFARKLRHTGGELIYLDDLWAKHRRPRLLLYTWYSFYFVLFYTTCTNSLQFANQILRASNVEHVTASWEPDRRLLGFIAFVISTAVCLLLYFDSQASRLVNAVLASAKVILLLCIFSAGVYYRFHLDRPSEPWDQAIREVEPFGWARAFLFVFFSFHGWENATFVAGEIPRYPILRDGFIAAVSIVGVLYIMIVAIFCSAYTTATGEGQPTQEDFGNYMALFFGNSLNAKRASAILIALSAVGSMISIAYTCIRVKQVIGWVNILPFSELLRRTDITRKIKDLVPRRAGDLDDRQRGQVVEDQAAEVRRGTPEGGIILHYIVTVVQIGISTSIKDLQTAIGLQSAAMIYGHFFYEAVLGIGFAFSFDPKKDKDDHILERTWHSGEAYSWFLEKRRGLIALGTVASGLSTLIIVIELLPWGGIGWWYLCAIGVLTCIAVIYWALFVHCRDQDKELERQSVAMSRILGLEITAHKHGVDDSGNPWRRCEDCSERTGEHRHKEDGYLDYNLVRFATGRLGRSMEKAARGFGDRPESEEVDQIPLTDMPSRRNTRRTEERDAI